jgi:putative ABC transport system substrate-binding protein
MRGHECRHHFERLTTRILLMSETLSALAEAQRPRGLERRRWLELVLSALAMPLATGAWARTGPALVAVLSSTNQQATDVVFVELKRRMAELGWIEGRDFVFETRYAGGHLERLAERARELVALHPDVIWTFFTTTAVAARQATSTIPIVVTSSADPVGAGLAQSLAKPGGNVTGLSNLNADAAPKTLELLHEAAPAAQRIAVLVNREGAPTEYRLVIGPLHTAAQRLSLTLIEVSANSPQEIDAAFATFRSERADALIVAPGALIVMYGPQVMALVAKQALPSIGGDGFAEGGGLLSYGQSSRELIRRSADYIDKILRGAKPGDLPIEQASRLKLVVNLKTARALGLNLPQRLLVGAEEVIR